MITAQVLNWSKYPEEVDYVLKDQPQAGSQKQQAAKGDLGYYT